LVTVFAQAEEFDLFRERDEVDAEVYTGHKSNVLSLSYSLFPSEQKKAAFEFSRYLNGRLGFSAGIASSERGRTFSEKAEFTAAVTYRFTKRAWTWIFSGDLGLSVNDDVVDLNGNSKGFRLNHFYGVFSAQYVLKNGFGLEYFATGRMTFETEVVEDFLPIHSLGLIYQF
jgi:hypothetical protein